MYSVVVDTVLAPADSKNHSDSLLLVVVSLMLLGEASINEAFGES